MEERLQKILARAGFASRRGAEQLMSEGRVTVNGQIAKELGTKADVERDDVRVDGVRVKPPKGPVYLLLNKPKGVVTTRKDPENRPTVMDLVPPVPGLFPVGRLDVTTEGLIILTNDGVFAERVSHPRYEVPRVYHAKVHGVPDGQTLERLRRGVTVEGDLLTVDHVRVLESDNNAWVEVTLHEGRKHEVKRLLEAVGHPVSKLRRVAFGPVTTKGLEPGQFRELLPEEIAGMVRGDSRPRTALHTGRKPKRHAPAHAGTARPRTGPPRDAGVRRDGVRRDGPRTQGFDRGGRQGDERPRGEDRRDSRSTRRPFDSGTAGERRGSAGDRRGATRPPFRSSEGSRFGSDQARGTGRGDRGGQDRDQGRGFGRGRGGATGRSEGAGFARGQGGRGYGSGEGSGSARGQGGGAGYGRRGSSGADRGKFAGRGQGGSGGERGGQGSFGSERGGTGYGRRGSSGADRGKFAGRGQGGRGRGAGRGGKR